jgi:hypothetical protein
MTKLLNQGKFDIFRLDENGEIKLDEETNAHMLLPEEQDDSEIKDITPGIIIEMPMTAEIDEYFQLLAERIVRCQAIRN